MEVSRVTNHKTVTIDIRFLALVLLSSSAISAASCSGLQATPRSLPPGAGTPTGTHVPSTPTITPTATLAPPPSPIPAKNGWVPEFTPTMTVGSTNAYSKEQIARILFTQWLDHFKTDDADSQDRLDDYRVSEVGIPKNLAQTFARVAEEKGLDYVGQADFSVKPSIFLYSNWNAGNGMSGPDHWVIDKGLIIGLDKEGGVYSLVIIGTGP